MLRIAPRRCPSGWFCFARCTGSCRGVTSSSTTVTGTTIDTLVIVTPPDLQADTTVHSDAVRTGTLI
jgi:hypothetical protein